METGPNTFSKDERISGTIAVAALLREGRWGSTGGVLKYCSRRRPDDGPSRIIVSVPKRFFKRAVRRNLLKRRIRESYRTQKALLGDGRYEILFQYNSTEVADFATIRDEVAGILTRLAK